MPDYADKQSRTSASDSTSRGVQASPGKTTLVEQAYPAGAPGAGGPVFVEFTKTGEWDAPAVVETLSRQASVPEELKAAILAGPQATAKFCVALRSRVQPPDAKIEGELTRRVTELVYATSRSPLQYRQLADVARWADHYKASGTAPPTAAGNGPAVDKPGQDGAATADAAAAAYATQLASGPGGATRAGDKDDIRFGTFKANEDHKGEDSGNAALAGWSFVRDPFDNTVSATRPAATATDDNAGLQFTFQATKADATSTTVSLVRTIVLSKLRLGVLKRQAKMASVELQETEAEKNARLANDTAMNVRDRKYDADHEAWVTGGKSGAEPVKPQGYLPVPHKNTLCVRTPGATYTAAGGTEHGGFNYDPRLQQAAMPWAWRTLASNPDGPKPGDVYYLTDVANGQGAHMGVFKSSTPIAGSEDLYSWVVTDGGQGDYAQIQKAWQRTRGPFSKKTGLFSSTIAEAGQAKGDRKLAGWVDIDAYNQGKPDARPPGAT